MPFWIQGWMEITTFEPESDDAIWFGLLDLSVLVDSSDDFSHRIFGLSKDYRRNARRDEPAAVFANRGWPNQFSEKVAAEKMTIERDHNSANGDLGGFTYANVDEICSSQAWAEHFSRGLPEDSDWYEIFQLASSLINRRVSPRQIRFVVWFNW